MMDCDLLNTLRFWIAQIDAKDKEIARLRIETDHWHKQALVNAADRDKLRAALEEIAFTGMSVSPAAGPPTDDYYKNTAYGMIGIAARAINPPKQTLEPNDPPEKNSRQA